MRLAIVGTVFAAALAVTSASAQTNTPQIMGNKAFCLKGTDKIDCSFDTKAACEMKVKDVTPGTGSAGSCVPRSEAR